MQQYTTVILKILTTQEAVAEECNALFGGGANPHQAQPEALFDPNNTPVQTASTGEQYVRVRATVEFAHALQAAAESGSKSANVELVSIEWQGQREFCLAGGSCLGVIAGMPIQSIDEGLHA